jgi:hypothetical protein
MEPDLFLTSGRQLKEHGMSRVESHNSHFMAEARKVARSFALSGGEVTIEEVRRYLEERGIAPRHPNAWGTVFKGAEWICTGFKPSGISSARGRMIRYWKLRE